MGGGAVDEEAASRLASSFFRASCGTGLPLRPDLTTPEASATRLSAFSASDLLTDATARQPPAPSADTSEAEAGATAQLRFLGAGAAALASSEDLGSWTVTVLVARRGDVFDAAKPTSGGTSCLPMRGELECCLPLGEVERPLLLGESDRCLIWGSAGLDVAVLGATGRGEMERCLGCVLCCMDEVGDAAIMGAVLVPAGAGRCLTTSTTGVARGTATSPCMKQYWSGAGEGEARKDEGGG